MHAQIASVKDILELQGMCILTYIHTSYKHTYAQVLSIKGIPDLQGHVVVELQDVDNRELVKLIAPTLTGARNKHTRKVSWSLCTCDDFDMVSWLTH